METKRDTKVVNNAFSENMGNCQPPEFTSNFKKTLYVVEPWALPMV